MPDWGCILYKGKIAVGMLPGGHRALVLSGILLWCAVLQAQVALTGRVVDENGAAVGGARVELRSETGIVTASSDPAGNFRASLPVAGEYSVRAERPGYFVFTGGRQPFEAGSQQALAHSRHASRKSPRQP